MKSTSLAFKDNVKTALKDDGLQRALAMAKGGFQKNRAAAAAGLPEFEALRDAAKALKDHTLDHLDLYLEAFEEKAVAAGAVVHWARDDAEARAIILEICRDVGAKSVTKSKSMVSEEIGLNEALETADIEPVETDLGEHIIQLAGEKPSHIIAPAFHVTKDKVSDLFAEHHQRPRVEEPEALLGEARSFLRRKYLESDVGITGANFLIAETGSIVLVTNEGNAELTQGLPKTHIALTGIEKVIPTLDDAFLILRLLARSATGQDFSAYTTLLTGPKRREDQDGPEAFHIVLLDNGRSNMLGTPFQDMLRCIRCGACMNHCPVYLTTGGHAYGWVYPGPMGAVLTPNFIGIEEAQHLPNASTFCGRCEQVCPMRIPLPKMMRHWREDQFQKKLTPPTARYGLAFWAFFAKRPRLYHRGARIAMAVLGKLGGRSGRFRSLPLAAGWTGSRDMPAPAGVTFQTAWKKRRPS